MGTKNNPGRFDCYVNAEPDEPMFILLGRDRHAPLLVLLWALLRQEDGEDRSRVEEARACAKAMDEWRKANRPPLPSLLMRRTVYATVGIRVAAVRVVGNMRSAFSDEQPTEAA
jgi:hypothetical protein